MIAGLARRTRSIAKGRLGSLLAARQPRRVDPPLETWGLHAGDNATLWSAGVDLVDLVARHGSPLHVVRADRLDVNAAAASGRGADIFFSYKTNPVPAVLRRLHDHGIGAEVISAYELWLAMRLGVPGDRLIYNGPAKSPDSIRAAIRHGVALINANSAPEAALIARLAAEERRVVNLGVRIWVPGAWGGQFGIADVDATVGVVRAGLEDRWVSLQGIHVHRGSTMRTASAMTDHVATVLTAVAELHARSGWHPSIIDVGGSLACPTSAVIPTTQFRLNRALGTDLLPPDPATCLTIGDAAELAGGMVAEAAAGLGVAGPRVVLEPGRAMTGDAQLLLTSVVDVKDDLALAHAILDAGINLAEPVHGEYHHLIPASEPLAPATTPYRLVGPICTPADVLYNHWCLPPLAPGHVLAIMDTGAYFVPFSTTFSFPKPAIAMQDGAALTIVRRRESFDDVVSYDDP